MRVLIAVSVVISCFTVAAPGCSPRRGILVNRVPDLSSASEQQGRLVFMENCNSCHPGGGAGVGPAINNKPVPAAILALQVRSGIGAMPAFSEAEISDEALSALVEYLLALRRAETPESSE